MHELILWCGFFGAWLLVAGPLYQAAQELDEQEWSREELATASTRVDAGDRPSAWWWLIPPVGYWKHHRYNDRQRAALIAALPRDAVAKYMGYVNTATAWFYVAAGAFLITLKETWELVEGHEWPTLVFWVLIVLMFVLAAGNTASRMSRTHRLVAEP